ncbi:MAG TPA: dihydropteroate synthase [Candidatus Polarisedimenticolaceae bacterium]|nr:dihydropteroate synthase [Candidatus Polarisedimenticolaceae bacterium]
MVNRAVFLLRFADGGTLELGHRTRVLGVLNLTPDSFSDGGRLRTPAEAVAAAHEQVAAGADLLDVGGESTRPGAEPVDPGEEARRVVPVVAAIRRELDVRLSIDTRRADVARRALDAGADLINDVSALGDPQMLPLLVERRVPVILMHMRGEPRTMQHDTRYADPAREVADFLRERAETVAAAGLRDGKILVDPGIGFGKSVDGNLQLLERLPELARVGHPIVIGASRKSFIGAVLDLPVGERLYGSLAAAVYACAQGVHVIRAHDVAATVQAVRLVDAIRARSGGR